MNFNFQPLLEEFLNFLRRSNLEKRHGIQPPQGETALLELYKNPANFKTPEAYWKEVGAFAFVARGFDHIPFLRTHKGFWVHRLLKPMVEEIFNELADTGLSKEIHSFDGCYNHRVIRGGTRLSLHSFGAAIDLNAAELPLGSSARLNEDVIKCFTKRGWTYGGNYTGRKDPMHFEFGSY